MTLKWTAIEQKTTSKAGGGEVIKSPEHEFFICHTDDYYTEDYYNDFDEYFQNYAVNDGDLQGDEEADV